jgi:membrane-anchored protein YejM (alkaline phosphatase superfamily)
VWLTLFDLHDFLDGIPDISNQVESKIDLHDYSADTSKSVYQVFDNNKKSRYEIEMKRVDFYLKILFDYINENYDDDEVVLSICSDHGQSYLNDDEEFLSECRVVVPMMFKSSSTPKVVSDDMISNVDYLPTLLHLSGIKYDKEKIDGLVPEIFNGDKGRKYCITESIYPNKHYYAAIYSKDEIFFLESKNKIGNSVTDIDLSELEITGYKYITLSSDEKSRVKLDEDNLEKMLRILIARQRNTS